MMSPYKNVAENLSSMTKNPDLKAIAFYLPQYPPIPENGEWWGKGFTEWTNVTKAKPLFPDHYQPHLPADLGFYDLRLPEARQAQANLAREYGIHGFCYYHYWFNGKRILEQPVNEILRSGEPDFPFCLCWANENWTRTWDGQEKVIADKAPSTYLKFPCVTPQWDNSARRKTGANIFHGSTPELYEKWLKTTVENITFARPDEKILFINAWNEWGEGNHLEPCQKWGRAYLEATYRALKGSKSIDSQVLTSRSIVTL
jgi:lipopolysaccharide biosynthesis protein